MPRLEFLEDRTVLSTLTVTSPADSGDGSLRAAIAIAQSGDQIIFDTSLKGQTITLASGPLAITQSLDIEGPGAGQLAISGNHASRIFAVSGGVTVTLAGLTITDGMVVGDDGGGAIVNAGSSLTLANDVLSNNVSQARSDSIYWADALNGTIQRASLDGSGQMTVVSGQKGPLGPALDLAGGKIYWADVFAGDIRRANLDGTGQEILVSGLPAGIPGINGLTLDLARGQMYWSDNALGDIHPHIRQTARALPARDALFAENALHDDLANHPLDASTPFAAAPARNQHGSAHVETSPNVEGHAVRSRLEA